MSSLDKYSLSPASSRTWIPLSPGGNRTGFPHAEGHTEHQSEPHITAVSNYPQNHSPCVYSSSLWFSLPANTTLCQSIPCWNRWSALAGCWRVTAQPKAHQNQPVDSQGLSKMCRHHPATHSPKKAPWKSAEAGISCWDRGEVVPWWQWEQHIPASVGRSRALSCTPAGIPAVLCVCVLRTGHSEPE